MATPAALGSGLQSYNPFLPADTNAKLRQIQMQQQLGQELQTQGLTPLDTNNRMMGQIAYKISPTEGLSKIADALLGSYEQKNANSKYADAIQGMGGASGQPNANMMAALYPEEAAKAMLGDHRPGASYWTPGGMQQSPTDLQINTGTVPAAQVGQPMPAPTQPVSPPPQGISVDPGGGSPGPQVPVQGPEALPPIAASALQPPPGGPQAAPPGSIPPPAPPQGQPITPAPGISLPGSANPATAAMPTPMPGESPIAFQNRMEIAKANQIAQGSVAPAANKKLAEDNATNLADAQKTFNVAAGNLPRAMQRFDQLRDASKLASSGGGVSDQEPEQGLLEHIIPGPDYARSYARTSMGQMFEPGRSVANQTIGQAASQGIMAELAPQLAGLKGNKFLESLASSASGLNPADPPDAKLNTITGLQDQYIGNMRSLAQQRRSYGDPTAPSDVDLGKMIAQSSPTAMISVIDPQGKNAKIPAIHLPDLLQAGGQFK